MAEAAVTGSALSHRVELSLGRNAVSGEKFGNSVSMSGNGHTVLVGDSRRTVDGRKSAGVAEVFRLVGGSWSAPTELSLGGNARAGDSLGSSVALSASGTTAIVGAPGRSVGGRQSAGAAEVFTFSGGRWSRSAQLTVGATARSDDAMGDSVAVSADGRTALVGGTGRAVSGKHNAGAVEVFTFNSGGWRASAQLSLGGRARVNDLMGWSVATSAGGTTALIGVPGRAVNSRQDSGAAEVFTKGGAKWSAPAQISLGVHARFDDLLGFSVALSADGHTALVGVPYRAVNGVSKGVAAVFGFRGGKWGAATQLALGRSAHANDFLGNSVGLSANGQIAFVGAPGRSVNGKSEAGAAEVFSVRGGRWTAPTQHSLGAGARKGDHLGSSVALSSGGHSAVGGAPTRSVRGRSNAGSCVVFN